MPRPWDTPLTLWSLQTEARLLADAVATNREARALNTVLLRDARTALEDLTREVKTAEDDHRSSGGADLERLTDEIGATQRIRDVRLERRSALAQRTTALATPLGTRTDFDNLQDGAETFLAEHTGVAARLTARRDELHERLHPLVQRKRDLTAERASFTGRQGRVPRFLDEMRQQVAAAAGMSPAELPFLAELIDIAPDQAPWRTAIETVLGGSARLLLLPQTRLEHFSAAIDPLHLRGRLNFEGIPVHLPYAPGSDPDYIAGKLLYADHPFRGWVARHVADPARNALCVATARDLAGHGYRVTQAGQTRSGARGSHGRADTANVIGFSSAEAIAEIDHQLDELEPQLAEIDRLRRAVDDERDDLDRRREAYQAVQGARWDDIDVAGADQRIIQLKETRQAILDADDRLRALEAHIDNLKRRLEATQERHFAFKSRMEGFDREHAELTERQDGISTDLYRLEDEQQVIVDSDQTARLDKEFSATVAPADPTSLPDFSTNLARLHQRLTTALSAARNEVTRSEAELGRIFEAFQGRWEDPNLGRTTASYSDYARILDNIVTTGLHTRREEWRRRLTTWSGQDLVPLSGAMNAAIEDIEDRLTPINEILATLPFGAGRDRLRIRLRRLTPEHVLQFRRDLRLLSSVATKGLEDGQLERRFAELQSFMGQMRRRDDPRANSETADRDRLLDVRKHVEITAERYSSDGVLLSTHSALGGKSGGESQELVAFIIGAALRFRLGDELRTRPRFAPVFLDEGFVKADAEFAGRAVQAWKGLGFQLIVGAPLDKVTALEPHMNELLAITKDAASGYSFVSHIADTTADLDGLR